MKSRHVVLAAVLGLPVLLMYLSPVAYILLASARQLPNKPLAPSEIQVEELGSDQSQRVLLQASDFTADQVSNEPFPETITGGAPGETPEAPPPRIRASRSDYKDWYAGILTFVFFPIVILAGGGPILFGILAVSSLGLSFERLTAWRRVLGMLAWVVLAVLLTGTTYLFAIWPRVLRTVYSQNSPLIWEDSVLTHYLEGGFSVDPNAPDQPMLTRLVVVNGTASSVDLYADGFYVDSVPAKGIRGYRRLRKFTRLTGIDRGTAAILDDFSVLGGGKTKGFLIYNVRGADSLNAEDPPHYD